MKISYQETVEAVLDIRDAMNTMKSYECAGGLAAFFEKVEAGYRDIKQKHIDFLCSAYAFSPKVAELVLNKAYEDSRTADYIYDISNPRVMEYVERYGMIVNRVFKTMRLRHSTEAANDFGTIRESMYCYEVDKVVLRKKVANLRSEYGFRRDVATMIVCMSEYLFEVDENRKFITEVLAAMGITPSGTPVTSDDTEDLFAIVKNAQMKKRTNKKTKGRAG